MTGTLARQTSTDSERRTREEMRRKMQVATVDMSAKGAKDDFNRSLQETGFAVLVNHGVDRKQIEGVYDEWRSFMMSLDEKVKAEGGHNCISEYIRSTDVFDGYFPMDLAETAKSADVKDIKHYYHLYFPHGRYPKEVSDEARNLFDFLYALGLKLCEWIDQGLSPETKQRLKKQGMDSLVECVSRPAGRRRLRRGCSRAVATVKRCGSRTRAPSPKAQGTRHRPTANAAPPPPP
ncbi:unnamed protein product, partial [Prorocentrum cordatum]